MAVTRILIWTAAANDGHGYGDCDGDGGGYAIADHRISNTTRIVSVSISVAILAQMLKIIQMMQMNHLFDLCMLTLMRIMPTVLAIIGSITTTTIIIFRNIISMMLTFKTISVMSVM